MSTADDTESSIDLFKLASRLWNRRAVIFACMGAALVFSILYLHVAPKLYTAKMIVVPANNQTAAQSLNMNRSLGAVASLAGIDLSKGHPQSAFDSYLLAIDTHETAAAMLARQDIASVVFKNQWNSEKKAWQQPASLLHIATDPVKWLLGMPVTPWKPPDAVAMATFIKTKVEVNKDKDTGAVTISFDYAAPQFAETFLLALHTVIDRAIKAKAARESAEYISYVSERLKYVTVAEQRTALADLLSNEEQRAVLAGSTLPYAADMFSAPFAPRKPSKPSPILVLFLGLVLGGAIGAALAFAGDRFGLTFNWLPLRSWAPRAFVAGWMRSR